MLTARRFLVTGRVQGVGFRFFVEAEARHEGLRGWVRNLPDGRVEAFAEGEADAVERLERKIRRGPSTSRVLTVDVLPDLPTGAPKEFEIR